MKSKKRGFICIHCHKFVDSDGNIGTAHRNHCPYCLWSKHVDLIMEGDRRSSCGFPMEPIGLTFKTEAPDKYMEKPEKGEIMVIQQCLRQDKISINRIAADDDPDQIVHLVEKSPEVDSQTKDELNNQGIILADIGDLPEIRKQLFGK